MTGPSWVKFWSASSWREWRDRRPAWREYTRETRRLRGEPDLGESSLARESLARPSRPISPAWVPGAMLVAVIAIGGSGDPSSADTPPVTGTTIATTTTTTVPTTTSVAARTSTTTVASTTTVVTVPSIPQSDVFLAPPVAGASGDPGASLPTGAEVVTVVSITDGDTLDVRGEDRSIAEVRLIGINSPEANECYSEEATQVLAVLAPVGSQIGMTRDVSDVDQFGRLLRYLWLGGMSVNEESVRRGVAIARRYAPDTALAGRLESAQAESKETQLGLWAPEACGPRAEASLAIVDLQYDAPGDDNQNLNQELIRVRNDGDKVVDLTGWVVKDESASHRFDFPFSFTLAPGETVAIHTGCGDDFGTTLFWCNVGSAIWNNDGDTAFLLDPNGNTHETYNYEGVTAAEPAPPTTEAINAFSGSTDCDPSYPDVCIPSSPPDLDCGEISHRRFQVVGDDPHGFDGNNDGVGCES